MRAARAEREEDRCLFFAHDPYLICTLHPMGVDTDECIDFRPDPNAEIEEQWSLLGYTFYGDELVPLRPSLDIKVSNAVVSDRVNSVTCSGCQDTSYRWWRHPA